MFFAVVGGCFAVAGAVAGVVGAMTGGVGVATPHVRPWRRWSGERVPLVGLGLIGVTRPYAVWCSIPSSRWTRWLASSCSAVLRLGYPAPFRM